MKYSEILLKGLYIQSQLKTLHWQTKSNSHHQIFSNLYEQFDEQNDELMQVIMGGYGKTISVGQGTILIKNEKDIQIQSFIEQCLDFYQRLTRIYSNDVAVLDILADIIVLFSRSLYLIKQQ